MANAKEIKVELKGWKAVVAIVAVLGMMGYGVFLRNATLDTEAKEAIKFWLVTEYMGKSLAQWQQKGITLQTAEESAMEILASGKVTIPLIKARGSKDEIIVQVKVLVDGKAPPYGKDVRYYQMRHSSITGWTVSRKTTALSYYMKLF